MLIFTVCNEVAKVMFLHVSVCPQGEYLGRYPPGTRYTPSPLGPGTPPRPGTHPQHQVHPHPRTEVHPPSHPRGQVHSSGTRYTPRRDQVPPRRRLLLRTVRILLECILVNGGNGSPWLFTWTDSEFLLTALADTDSDVDKSTGFENDLCYVHSLMVIT